MRNQNGSGIICLVVGLLLILVGAALLPFTNSDSGLRQLAIAVNLTWIALLFIGFSRKAKSNRIRAGKMWVARITAIGLLVYGGFFAYGGISLHYRYRGCNVEPTTVNLTTIEAGKQPPNPHVRIDECVAYYTHCVTDGTDHYLIVPIRSTPPLRRLDSFATVLVTASNSAIVPKPMQQVVPQKNIRGLMRPASELLSAKNLNRLRKKFPSVDFGVVWVLDRGRLGSSSFRTGILMIGLCIILVAVSIGIGFGRNKNVAGPSASVAA